MDDSLLTVNDMIRQLEYMVQRGLGNAPLLLRSATEGELLLAGHPSITGMEQVGALGPLVRADQSQGDLAVVIGAA